MRATRPAGRTRRLSDLKAYCLLRARYTDNDVRVDNLRGTDTVLAWTLMQYVERDRLRALTDVA